MTVTEFTSKQVCTITGVTPRQLNYWRNTALIIPSQQTRGGHARYTFQDIVAVKTAQQLISVGTSVQRIRKTLSSLLEFLPTVKQPLSELSVLATADTVLVFQGGAAFEPLTGQTWILEIAELQRDIAYRLQGNSNNIPQQQDLFTKQTGLVETNLPNKMRA